MSQKEPINVIKVVPEEFKLFSPVGLDYPLVDVRIKTYGLTFGTLRQICSQYGIKYQKCHGGHIFYAPKARLQHLLEKLHFSQLPYSLV